MVRFFAILIAFVFATATCAQDDSTKFRYHSVLKGDATISPGYLLSTPQTNIYINGSLEYFPEDKISLRGESFVMVGAQQKPALLTQNSSLMFGALYHFHKNRFDFFVGLETGASLTKPRDSVEYAYKNPVTVSAAKSFDYKVLPIICPVTGVTFYVSNYFNFFLNVHYVRATYYGYANGGNILLDELRISAGLGFQIHVLKKK
jgi:hypothetical protein